MIIRDVDALNPETRELCLAQQNLIIEYNLPFKIFETRRTDERQAECYANGTSKIIHSNHQDGEAWDEVLFIKAEWLWEPIYWFQVLGILTLGKIKGLRWGADWNGKSFWFDESFRDYCHWERIK